MRLNPDTLPFFDELLVNNNREWFNANKDRWLAIKADFETFTEALIAEMVKLDPSLANTTAKSATYRIYRDTRFSSDKRPYKTHIACFLPTGGIKRMGVPGYYLQLGQEDYGLHGNCSLGGGIFMPSPEALFAIRQEIFYNIDEFKAIMSEKKYHKFFGDTFFTVKKLSKTPKGFPSDWPDADLLRYKDYTTMYEMPDKYIMTDELLDRVVEVFRASVPLNRFIQRAMYELI
jgi:uncharacterized protein (TIGR02453 family)